MMKLSDYMVKFLEDNGVKDVFMLTGGGCMHLVDSFGKSKKIKYLCAHHEQACAMAAEAYAKFKNDLGVVLVTSGPGVTNALTGLVGAFQDSAPCLFISGQSKRRQTVFNEKEAKLRQFGTQEVNAIPMVESACKFSIMVNEPEKIRYYLEKALYLAKNGRPGPVWLDVPLDVQSSQVDEANLQRFDPSELESSFKRKLTDAELLSISSYFKKAKRPMIIAGHGIRLAGACSELVAFADRFNIPVVTTILGIDVIPTGNKNYAGRIGIKGTRAGNFAIQNADLILSIGSRLAVPVVGHEYKLFAREAKVIVVDIDPEEHKKKTIRIDKFVQADAGIFIKEIQKYFKKDGIGISKTWLARCLNWKRKYPVCLPQYKKANGDINLYYFVETLNKKIKSDMPVISDAGSVFYAVSQGVNIKKGQRYITSGALATMGFSLPAAIGVCIANNRKSVAAITGDGSFQLNIQELQTIIHYKLPVKIFVINNNGYLSIRQTQARFFNSHFVGEGVRSGVSFPDIRKIAFAYGIKYIKLTCANLSKGLDQALKDNVPVICEVKSPENQQIIPTNTAEIGPNGVMASKPLEDMFPFLDRKIFLSEMIVKPVG
ncbi:MAG: thiamine pyrophosphate-binding protein [Candidatus Omnitrophota bacterium]|jgi:acetolactate synthase-1/2/3 large subunit